MTSSRVQSINPNDPNAIRKIIEALEVSEGIRGNENNRKPTVKEVQEMISGTSTIPINSSVRTFTATSGGSEPTKPTGLFVKEDGSFLIVGWDSPSFTGYGGSEVFRSITDQLTDAILIGRTSSNYYVDTVPDNITYYYFIRHKKTYSLGSGTGPYAVSVSGKKIIPSISISPKVGVITSSIPTIDVEFGVVDNTKTLLINVKGVFNSETDYDFTTNDPVPEDGNAVGLEIKKNGNILTTATPVKTQISHIGPYGEIKYLHLLDKNILEPTESGQLTYTLTAARLFPANTEPFEVAYSIIAI